MLGVGELSEIGIHPTDILAQQVKANQQATEISFAPGKEPNVIDVTKVMEVNSTDP